MCSKKAKDVDVEVFNMILYKNESKAMTRPISCNCKCKFNSKHIIQIKNGIMKHVNVNVKIVVHTKNTIAGILVHAFMRIASI